MLEILKLSQVYPNKRLPLEIDEFQGKVKVASINGKGRGLFAYKNFNPGDLIIAHRALEIIFPETNGNLSQLLEKIKKFRLLKESLAKKSEADKELRYKLLQLSAGPKLGFINTDDKEDVKLTMKRIEGIIIVNGFQGQRCDESEGHPFGLWYLPSFINHDCFKANAIWQILSDFIFIRAGKVIKEGDEILISYIEPDQPYHVRRELFLKHDFICVCKLCEMEKDEGEMTRCKRDTILNDFKNYCSDNQQNSDPNVLREFVDNLNKMRLSPTTNPFAVQPLMQLGLIYYENKCYEDAIKEFTQAFHISREFVQFFSFCLLLTRAIISCYVKIDSGNSKVEIYKWMDELKKYTNILYGCSKEVEWLDLLKFLKPDFFKDLETHELLNFNSC